jgi:hypothetical protein
MEGTPNRHKRITSMHTGYESHQVTPTKKETMVTMMDLEIDDPNNVLGEKK